MDNSTPTFTCPTCGYDLAGVVHGNNSVKCPECGCIADICPKYIENRSHIIRFTILWIFLLPLLHSTGWYIATHFDLGLRGAGYAIMMLGAQALYLITIPIAVLRNERKLRELNAFTIYTPTAWRVNAYLVGCWLISAGTTLVVLFRMMLIAGGV